MEQSLIEDEEITEVCNVKYVTTVITNHHKAKEEEEETKAKEESKAKEEPKSNTMSRNKYTKEEMSRIIKNKKRKIFLVACICCPCLCVHSMMERILGLAIDIIE